MIFSSIIFLFCFLPIILFLYYVVKNRIYKNIILLIASLLFYMWGEPQFIAVMICEVLLDYSVARLIAYFAEKKKELLKKICMFSAILCNLGVLCFFKYMGFIVGNVNQFCGSRFVFPDHALPIGISFFTFQAMSYVIDVYRGRVQAQISLYKVMLYISFFPQLIAGPIVRYSDVIDAIDNRGESLEQFASGCSRFIVGLAKKVLLADVLAVLANLILNNEELLHTNFAKMSIVGAWMGALAYTLQIYFDFSGYSDMAIGLGRMFGFEFRENFNYPYMASSIKDFWRRWHISLSSWFRDYVYIPLGGNRKGNRITIRNLCIVWILTGLWHGASWNFVLWGGIWFVLILIEDAIKISDIKRKPIRLLWRIGTLILICCNWMVFRLTSLQHVRGYLLGMFGENNSIGFCTVKDGFMLRNYGFMFLVAILCCFPWKIWLEKWMANSKMSKSVLVEIVKYVGVLALFVFSVASIARGNYSPFIYFNF